MLIIAYIVNLREHLTLYSTNQLKVIRHTHVTRTCHVYNMHNMQRKNAKTCGVACMFGNACTSDVYIQ